MAYYNTCIEKLHQEFKLQHPDKEKVLIVNTCGWVEGLGAEIQVKIVEKI
jgi:polynucleotide 5'-kinase involved in rRNA processing